MSREDAIRLEELQQDLPLAVDAADHVKNEPADDPPRHPRDKRPSDGRRSPRRRSHDRDGSGDSGGERPSSGSERFDRRAQPLRRTPRTHQHKLSPCPRPRHELHSSSRIGQLRLAAPPIHPLPPLPASAARIPHPPPPRPAHPAAARRRRQ